jgi:hypothetical protein
MKQKLIGLSQRYVTALRKHLEQGPRASLLPALGLGRRAVVLGLETLDLARIHERAVTALELRKKGWVHRAGQDFFYRSHHADRGNASGGAEGQNSFASIDRNARAAHGGTGRHQRQLRRGIVRRKTVEAALKKSGERYARLLKDSLQLQDGLAATDAPGAGGPGG